MQGFHRYMAVSLIALALPCSVIAATRNRPVRAERLKLSPADRRAAVLADLTAMLTGPAATDAITTRPYLTYLGGLCRRDVIKIAYAPVGGRTDWDAPLKPQGIRGVYSQYHLLEQTGARRTADLERACARLSSGKAYWATTDGDDHRAHLALTTLEIAVDAARNEDGIKIDCTELDEPQPLNCMAEFIAEAARIESFYSCPDRLVACYAFSTNRYQFSVDTMWDSGKRSITVKMSYADIVVT